MIDIFFTLTNPNSLIYTAPIIPAIILTIVILSTKFAS